ncbi:MAG TPA: RDD family protein, partial [Candidatus Limnocylindrales bacterium]|nr:RDD family protein [Candidatus Limnocylindrales bacterium]
MEPDSAARPSHWQAAPPAPEAPPGWRYAGFWIRLAAYLIDSVVLGAIFGASVVADMLLPLRGPAGPLFALASLVYLLYLPVLWWRGQTVGMRLLGLHLVRADGNGRLSLGRAFL